MSENSFHSVDVPIIETTTGEKSEITVLVDSVDEIVPTASEAVEKTDGDLKLDPGRFEEFDWEHLVEGGDTTDSIDEEPAQPVDDAVSSSRPTPDEILEDNAALYESKNDDYGAAWRIAGETTSMWATELDIYDIDPQDPQQMVSMNLFIQRLHKLIRAFNLTFGEFDPEHEPIVESHRDASTYSAIHAHHSFGHSETDE